MKTYTEYYIFKAIFVEKDEDWLQPNNWGYSRIIIIIVYLLLRLFTIVTTSEQFHKFFTDLREGWDCHGPSRDRATMLLGSHYFCLNFSVRIKAKNKVPTNICTILGTFITSCISGRYVSRYP